MERVEDKGDKIAELVKQWKLIDELDDDDRKDLALANIQTFYDEVKELTSDEYKRLLVIIRSK